MSSIDPISQIADNQQHSTKPAPHHTAAYTQVMMKEIGTFGNELRRMQAEDQQEIREEKQAAGEQVPSEIQSF